jgi:hypothetical protein
MLDTDTATAEAIDTEASEMALDASEAESRPSDATLDATNAAMDETYSSMLEEDTCAMDAAATDEAENSRALAEDATSKVEAL